MQENDSLLSGEGKNMVDTNVVTLAMMLLIGFAYDASRKEQKTT
jgi:hypothetical protein